MPISGERADTSCGIECPGVGEKEVKLEGCLSLSDIIGKDLRIPDYQRIYCWPEKNVKLLLDDICDSNKEYHLGNIILQSNPDGKSFDIIDGQQRLVTLALILSALGRSDIPLLKQKFESWKAKEYIAYNKSVIDDYIGFNIPDKKAKAEEILPEGGKSNIVFSVITLKQDTSLDLAYTFFSNQNSKGVPLSNYDLLKSHHLRFVSDEAQAKHLARNWDAVLKYDKDKTLRLYLFRMRKWLYGENWNEKYRDNVKEEFEAAPVIPEIPPFGEKFLFNEPIQGGAYFFSYANSFILRSRNFYRTEAYKALGKLSGKKSHDCLRNVTEALLFAYYLKFGDMYLSEALFYISETVSGYRMESGRVTEGTLNDQSFNKEIMRMIDRASSPTFFLAAIRNMNKSRHTAVNNNLKGIKLDYSIKINSVYEELKKHISSNTVKGDLK